MAQQAGIVNLFEKVYFREKMAAVCLRHTHHPSSLPFLLQWDSLLD